MPILERTASKEKLAALLAEGHESEQLDYKETTDLSTEAGEWEMAKDLGAMEAMGGYIVVGVDNAGVLTGRLTAKEAELLDEARLRAKMRKYLTPPLDLLAGTYEMEIGKVATCIYVGPNPKGLRILALPGGERKGCPFRNGDIFVRHGTSSERWDQSDIDQLIERIVIKRKEQWRRERVQDEARVVTSQGELTVAAIDVRWTLDEETFFRNVLEALQANDSVSLRISINEMMGDATQLFLSEARDEFETLMQRLTCIGAVATILNHFAEAELVGRALVRLYDLVAKNPAIAPEMWLAIGARVEALGASAVRQEAWALVRYMALLPAVDPTPYNRFLLRHAVTHAGRSGLLPREKSLHGLVSVARAVVDNERCLRSDAIPAGSDLLINALCQFDFLAVLAAMDDANSMDTAYYYTNFAAFYTRRVEPVVLKIIRGEPVRQAIYPRPDDELAQVLSTIDRLARGVAFKYGGWDGFSDSEILSFMREHGSSA